MGARRPLVTVAEEHFAAALVRAGLGYRYEPRQFNMHADQRPRVRGFRPDFFIPELSLYVEVGPVRHKRPKLGMMRRCFPNVRVLVVDNAEALRLDSMPGADVEAWMWERWAEQEYHSAKFIGERRYARERAMRPRHPSAPSARLV